MSDIVAQDHRLTCHDGQHGLLLRNKRRRDRVDFEPDATVLFCHGATYASSVTSDYPLEGSSWMDQLARAGFDVWALDLLGYGGSDRPAAMDGDPAAHPPLVDTAHAVADMHRALDFVLDHRGLPRLCLIGYSWGTLICGAVAGARPEQVARLVLYGAVWRASGEGIHGSGDGSGAVGAYRTVTAQAMTARWTLGLTPPQAATVQSPARMRAWAETVLATDPTAAERSPPSLRAPAGVVKDLVGGPLTWDPGVITAPTLVVVGAWDRETTPEQGRAVFDRLTGAAQRGYLVIGDGTHALLLENQRRQLFDAVAAFLGEGLR